MPIEAPRYNAYLSILWTFHSPDIAYNGKVR